MRNFQKLAEGIDGLSLLHDVTRKKNLWNSNTVRTSHPLSAHRVIDDIILRYNPYNPGEDFVEKVCSEIHCENYPAWDELPAAQGLIFALMSRLRGIHLGRVMISRVAPGVCIPPHTDLIPQAQKAFPNKTQPALYYQRYHIVLKSQPGVVFRCGEEQVYMASGEAWWFDNVVEHEVVNNSSDDRIHLILDIRA